MTKKKEQLSAVTEEFQCVSSDDHETIAFDCNSSVMFIHQTDDDGDEEAKSTEENMSCVPTEKTATSDINFTDGNDYQYQEEIIYDSSSNIIVNNDDTIIFHESNVRTLSIESENIIDNSVAADQIFEKNVNGPVENSTNEIEQDREIEIVNKKDQDNCMPMEVDEENSNVVTTEKLLKMVCQVCGKLFKTVSNLNCHMRVHSDARNYACEQCPKTYKYSTQLKNHLRKHTGQKPFLCGIEKCGKSFAQHGQLRKHLRTHTGDRPYECSVCSKRFSRGTHLRSHQKLHTGSELFECTECDKVYTQKPQLRIHMQIHTGIREFKCTICDKEFFKLCVLKNHIKTHNAKK